jgi:glycosyltransferase involved in cell wall biosynthesis
MISIVIPAHNEASVIGRCLEALLPEPEKPLFQIIVVANGCADATAEVARSYGRSVMVLETPVASKANALNMGDSVATGFPRVYLDADVVISANSVERLGEALAGDGPRAAAPQVAFAFPERASWLVRCYYDFWTSLPYVREGMVTAGAYAVNAAGRSRFGAFPDVICDDTYFRFHFSAEEREEVKGATCLVTFPGRLFDLIRIRTRTRVGLRQLKQLFPQLLSAEMRPRRYLAALRAFSPRPTAIAGAGLYLLVHLFSSWRAQRQARSLAAYAWERDTSSRPADVRQGRRATVRNDELA